MKNTRLYGFSHDHIESVVLELEKTLRIPLQARDSLYLGDYFAGDTRAGHQLMLRRNIDPLFDERTDPPEDRFAERDFPGVAILLYVTGEDTEETYQVLMSKVEGIEFLIERK